MDRLENTGTVRTNVVRKPTCCTTRINPKPRSLQKRSTSLPSTHVTSRHAPPSPSPPRVWLRSLRHKHVLAHQHLRSHGRPWPRWNARRSHVCPGRRSTDPRTRCNDMDTWSKHTTHGTTPKWNSCGYVRLCGASTAETDEQQQLCETHGRRRSFQEAPVWRLAPEGSA